jgi:TldD protein
VESPSVIDYASLLKRALAHGGDFSEIFTEERRGTSITAEAKRIERYIVTEDFGVGIRVISGDKSAYAYTNDLRSLSELADTVASAMHSKAFTTDIALEKRMPRSIVRAKIDPVVVDAPRKIEMVKRAERFAWGYENAVVQVKVMYGDNKRHVTIANSKGFLVEDEMQSILFVVLGIVAKDSLMETGYEPIGGARGFELLDEVPPELVAERAMQRAVQALHARKAPAGRMPVVLSSAAGGTMVHEAIGHGLEADLAGDRKSVV